MSVEGPDRPSSSVPWEGKGDSAAAKNSSFPVVGIGASAGGFEAFSQLLQNLPAPCGMALVLIQHLDPSHASSLAELLTRTAHMPVRQATEGTTVNVDNVYVIPPNTSMVIRGGILHLGPRTDTRGPPMPIDGFLTSLAADRTHQAIGVILSGTGSDGTVGLKAIKGEGGITFAQDQSAKYDGMPQSAIAGGWVDFVLPPERIAEELLRIGQHPYVNRGSKVESERLQDDQEPWLQALFQLVRKATGLDFALYKRGTVMRRIQRRMVLHKLDKLANYVDFVREHAAEAQALGHDMLIHVTNFFRELETFEVLKEKVFSSFLANRQNEVPIRVWVPGCSSGEEVYSLAICSLEFCGNKSGMVPVKIFGTDVSEIAIEQARAGKYLESIAADVSAERLRRFFTHADHGYQVNKAIRDMCVFARHDVTRDPPFSNMDLISCRNVLIYLGAALQKRVMPTFHYALKETGYLLLGSSETIGPTSDFFNVVDAKHKIYTRKSANPSLAFDFTSADPTFASSHAAPVTGHGFTNVDIQREADRLLLAKYAPPGVVINADMDILQARGRTAPFLELPTGALSVNLLKMARGALLLPLRAAVDEAKKGNAQVRRQVPHFKVNDHFEDLCITVTPFSAPTSKQRLLLVLFEVHAAAADEAAKPVGSLDLSQAPDVEKTSAVQLQLELTATRSYLEATIEELEASNEELKALNEEVVSSNEELRSTNEELQTAKEELQATNEELGTVNEELQHRNEVTTELNDDLANLLSSVQIPIVMLGQDLRIRRFTPSAAKVLNLIPTDVGRPLSHIKPRIKVDDLDALITHVLESFTPDEREVQDTAGHWYNLSIRPYRTQDNKIDGAVLSVFDVDRLKRSETLIREGEARLRAILNTAAEGIIVLDERGVVQSFNKAAERMFNCVALEAIGRNITEWLPALEREELASYLVREGKQRRSNPSELVGKRKDGSKFPVQLAFSEVHGSALLYTAIVRDITELKQSATELSAAHNRALQAERLAAIGELSAHLAHESRNALQRGQACLEMLAREIKDEPRCLDLIARLKRAQSDLLKLYEGVRAYAGPVKPERRPCQLDKILHDAWDQLAVTRQGRDVKLTSLAANVDLQCVVDPAQIEQVFRNVLENALQSGDGALSIEAVWSEVDWIGKPALRVALRNDGPALTAEQRSRLFEPFYTSKTHGTGLGMTIAKRIIEAHDGRIQLGTDPGADRGVEIVITLPRGQS